MTKENRLIKLFFPFGESHGDDTHDDKLQGVIKHQRQQDDAHAGKTRQKHFGHHRAVNQGLLGAAEYGGDVVFGVEAEQAADQRHDFINQEE